MLPRPKCDTDDLICQIELLGHLRGVQKGLSDEKFQEDYPELVDLDSKIQERIEQQKSVVEDSIKNCYPMSGSVSIDDEDEE